MPIVLPQRPAISVGDTEVVSINYTDHLDSGESLTGTPTVAEVTTTDLTLDDKAVNTATYVEADSGDTVAVGAAVQFSVAGGTAANSPYTIRVTVSTDATPARTFVRDVKLGWE
jgi:hypothetical protein